MRFLLRKQPTAEQRKRLQTTEQVNFVPMEAVGENGGLDLDLIREKTSVEKGYTLFFDGDVVVAKITPCFENGKGALAVGLYEGAAYGTTELHVLSPLPKLDKRFLFYLTISHTFRKQGEAAMKGAAGQKRVPDEFIQDFRFPLPPLAIQHRIADYLDIETVQIDVLVAEKERMLKLLEEKRVALVSRIVIRGLNPNVPMQSSDLAWLGNIPVHWELRRAK
jgi:type I restriction enzyme, S subunit